MSLMRLIGPSTGAFEMGDFWKIYIIIQVAVHCAIAIVYLVIVPIGNWLK